MSTQINWDSVTANQLTTLPTELVEAGWRLENDSKKPLPHRAKNDRLGLYTEASAFRHEAISRAISLHECYALGNDRSELLPEDLKSRGWKLYERDGISPWHAENDALELSTGGFPNSLEAIARVIAMRDEEEERLAIQSDGKPPAPPTTEVIPERTIELETQVPAPLAAVGWKLEQTFVYDEPRYRAYNTSLDLTTEPFTKPDHAIAAAGLVHEQRDLASKAEPVDDSSAIDGGSRAADAEVLEKQGWLDPKQIRTDGGTQPRVALNLARAAEYMEAMQRGDQFPPADVFYDGTNYWLSRGFHRHWAAQHADMLLRANVHQGTQRDAVLHSLGANATHGLPRTNEEKRGAVVKMLLDPEWTTWSDSHIAKTVNVSQPYVGKVRSELVSQNVLSEQGVRKGADGVARDTRNIGSRVTETPDNRQPTFEEIDGVKLPAASDDEATVAVSSDDAGASGTAVSRTCRACSCTDEKPCFGGCTWVEEDLCSEYDNAAAEMAEPAPATESEARTTADIVEAIRNNGGSMFKMQLEEAGFSYAAILNALSDDAITQPETGKFALPETPPTLTEAAPASTSSVPSHSQAAVTKPKASIDDLLKGRMLSVSFVWIPGVKGKVQVSVNTTTDPTKATRESIESEKVRGFDEAVQRMIVAQLNGTKAPQVSTPVPAKKKAPVKASSKKSKKIVPKRTARPAKGKTKPKAAAKKKSGAKGRKR